MTSFNPRAARSRDATHGAGHVAALGQEFQSARRALARRDGIRCVDCRRLSCFNPRAARSRDATRLSLRDARALLSFQSARRALARRDLEHSEINRCGYQFQSARRALARRDLL